jgi:hypothetical protein
MVIRERFQSIKNAIIPVAVSFMVAVMVLAPSVVVSAQESYPELSVSYSNANGLNTVTLANPSGVEVGDLLIAIVGNATGVLSYYSNVSAPAGWCEFVDMGQCYSSLAVYWKVVTSADISNNSYTFTGSYSGGTTCALGARLFYVEAGSFDVVNPLDNLCMGYSSGASSLTLRDIYKPYQYSKVLFVYASWYRTFGSYDIGNLSGETITEVYNCQYSSGVNVAVADCDTDYVGVLSNFYTALSQSGVVCGVVFLLNPDNSSVTTVTNTITDTQTVTDTQTITDTQTVTDTIIETATETETVTSTLSTVTETVTSTIQTATVTETVITTLDTATVTETVTTASQTITETETTTIAELTETTTRTVIGEVDTGAMIDSWLLIAYIAVLCVTMILTVFYRTIPVRLIVIAMAIGLIFMQSLQYLQIGAALIVAWQIYELLKDVDK